MEPVRRAETADFPPEFELLLACGRLQQQQVQSNEIDRLLRQPLDWHALLALASWHGLVPLLAVRLKPLESVVPADTRQRLWSLYTQAMQHNLRMTTQLSQVLSCLAARKVSAVPFKGPWLAERLYGNLALRQSADLDLLIRRQDVLAALEALRAMGFAAEFAVDSSEVAALAAADFELSLNRDGIHVELHWDSIPRFYGIRFGLDECWPRVRQARACGMEVTELAPEDLFLALSLHGNKHLWARLIWVLDLAQLVRANANFDWELLLSNSRDLHIERLVLVSVLLVHELFGDAIPEQARQACERRPEFGGLLAQIYSNLGDPSPHLEGLKNYWFFLSARDSWSDRWRQLLRHAMIPGPGEWRAMPRGLPMPVHVPVHLLRLSWKLCRDACELGMARLRNAGKSRATLRPVGTRRGPNGRDPE